MLFMVIDHFRNGDPAPVYERYHEQGRMMPNGLGYFDSWVEPDFARCFQLMECDDAQLLQQWASHWQDLVDFEIVPVISSKDAASRFGGRTQTDDTISLETERSSVR